MRKILILLFITFSCNLCAQIADSVLIDFYGQIRSDMVRDVCRFIGFQNDSILKTISNESLKDFCTEIKKAKVDTLSSIISMAKSLSGSDIKKHHDNIEATRIAFRNEMSYYYPRKRAEIENLFIKYIEKNDKLTEECITFVNDRDNYISKYPNGIFAKFFNNKNDNDLSDVSNNDNDDDKNMPTKKANADGKPVGESGTESVSFFYGMLFGAILLLMMYYFFKKGKIKVGQSNKQNINELDKKVGDINKEKVTMVLPKEIVTSKNVTDKIDYINEKSEQVTNEPQKNEPRNEEPISESPKREDINNVDENKVVESPVEGVSNQTPTKPFDPKGKCMAIDAGEWIVVGASVQGNGHISMNMPCQDNHGYEYLGDGWGIAITSDGAGSAKLSHMGSAATVSRAMLHFKELVEKEGWKNMSVLPADGDWIKKSYKVLKRVRDELEALANKNKCGVKDLSATIITVIHSPLGLLVAHIGDGRAGYKDMSGEWHSIITPHKGEEANQTIFIPSDFWNIPFYEMSGATVPESRVIRDKVAAFTLMSDGCENTSWLCNQFNETTGKYFDPNVPYKKFFDPLLNTLQSYRENNITIEEREAKWYSFIKEGNNSFVRETDDKTMILGALYM